MTRFTVTREGHIVGDGGGSMDPDDLETLLDEVQEQLLALVHVLDPDLSAALAAGDVRLCVDVQAPDAIEAVRLGDGAIRTALHAAGVATPAWEAPESAAGPARAELEGGTLTVQPS